MSGNAEMNLVNDWKTPDSIQSNAISQSANQSSDEDASEVGWLGTVIISKDWSGGYLDSEDGTPAKNTMAQQSEAKSFLTRRKWLLKTAMKEQQAGAVSLWTQIKWPLKVTMAVQQARATIFWT